MREFAKVSPQFWIGQPGKQIKDIGIEAQLISVYLLTCPHSSMIGIYYLPITLITHETGIPLEAACKALRSLCEVGFCTYDEEMEYVWVHEMASYQVGGQLKQCDNRVKCINDLYQNLPNLLFLPSFFEKYKDKFWLGKHTEEQHFYEASSKDLLSKEKEKEKDKEKEKEKEKEKKKKISMSGKPDADFLFEDFVFEKELSTQKNPQTLFKSQALEVLQFLNEKTGRVYRPVDTNLKLIIARLKSGASVMNCRQVIAKKTREWRGDAKMSEYLRPATLFNATKFEQYVGELVVLDEENNDE